MNYANEIHRFGRAGELYTQANFNHEKLSKLLDGHGREGRRLEPDDVHLRSDARSDPRAEPALVPGLPASVARGVLQAEMTRHGTFWIGWTEDAGSEVAEELPGLDGRACASSR